MPQRAALSSISPAIKGPTVTSAIQADSLLDHFTQLRQRTQGRDYFLAAVRPCCFSRLQTLTLRAAAQLHTDSDPDPDSDSDSVQGALAISCRDPLTLAVIAMAALFVNRSALLLNPFLSQSLQAAALQRGLDNEEAGFDLLISDTSADNDPIAGTAADAVARHWQIPAGGPRRALGAYRPAVLFGTTTTETQLPTLDADRPGLYFDTADGQRIALSLRQLCTVIDGLCTEFAIQPRDRVGTDVVPWQVEGFVLGPALALLLGTTWLPNPVPLTANDLPHFLGTPHRWQASHYFIDTANIAIYRQAPSLYDDSFAITSLQRLAVVGDNDSTAINTTLASLEDKFHIAPLTTVAFSRLLGTHTGTNRTAAHSTDGPHDEQTDPDTNDALTQQIYQLAADKFKTDSGALNPNSDGENTDGWTSLTSVELILAIEDELGIAFTPREIMTMLTLGDVVRACRAKITPADTGKTESKTDGTPG